MNKNPKDLSTDPPSDDFEIRCPRLGHQINFPYCRIENNGLPCFKTLDCWYNHFDIHGFLVNKLSEQDFKKIFVNKAKPKVNSLLDLIEQAKERKEKQD